jgi:NADH dehydrogenase [ubiquinone] 1 alpha subcomplex assembly factor 1
MTPASSPSNASPSLLLFDARPGAGPDASGNASRNAGGAPTYDASGDASLITGTGDWRIINDTVMGGKSSSQFSAESGYAAFSGIVSLDGGGFASVRSPSGPYDLGAADRFALRVRGDGKTYNFTAYTETGRRISYRNRFDAPSEWTRITISFDDLTPYRRGREVPSAPEFAPSEVREVGFLIGDKQGGPFQLDIAWIGAE